MAQREIHDRRTSAAGPDLRCSVRRRRQATGANLVEGRAVTVNELHVVGVRVELPTNQPIVLLREVEGERYLPIWIGAVEATAIAFAQQGVVPPRPLTHDLMRDVLAALGAKLRAVRITEMRDNVFYAELVFDDGREVSARPSDAIALGVAYRGVDLRIGVSPRRGRHRDCGRARGRGRGGEVPRVPRHHLARRLRHEPGLRGVAGPYARGADPRPEVEGSVWQSRPEGPRVALTRAGRVHSVAVPQRL